MDRDDADKHLEQIKNTFHSTPKTYKHIAKLFEFILYELDHIKDIEAAAPSVYASEANYDDYPDELPEVPDVEPEPEVSESCDYIDAATVPMVFALNGLAAPFRMDESKPAEESAGEVEKTPPVEKAIAGPAKPAAADNVIMRPPRPTRLRITGESDKAALHADGLKRVKEQLKMAKTQPKAEKA